MGGKGLKDIRSFVLGLLGEVLEVCQILRGWS